MYAIHVLELDHDILVYGSLEPEEKKPRLDAEPPWINVLIEVLKKKKKKKLSPIMRNQYFNFN